jgi:CRP-like cAMP-binding protein
MRRELDLLDALRNGRGFAGLAEEEVQALRAALYVEDFPTGHVFTREGEPGSAVHVLFEGRVRVTRASAPLALDTVLGPGEVFGLIALLDHGSRTATCRAEGPVKVGTLYAATFHLLTHARAPLASHFQHQVAVQLARDTRRLQAQLRRSLGALDTRPAQESPCSPLEARPLRGGPPRPCTGPGGWEALALGSGPQPSG